MESVTITVDKRATLGYTAGWLHYMCAKIGAKVVPPGEADIELVSICSSREMGLLLKPPKAPVRIVGGSAAMNDHVVLMFADAVCCGDGYEFFRDAKEADSFIATFAQPYMLTAQKSEARVSSWIDWEDIPLVRTTKHKYVYLMGRGCHRKCKFCYSTWTTKYQNNPNTIPSAEGRYVLPITNNSELTLDQKTKVRSLTVKSYLGMNKAQAKNCYLYRMGLESFSQYRRKWLGKPVKNHEVRTVARAAKDLQHRVFWFIIAGLDPMDSVDEFCDAIPYDPITIRPRMVVKATWFNANQHTPMRNWDMRNLKNWRKSDLWDRLTRKNGRFRLMMRKDRGDSLFRTIMFRARTEQEARAVWKVRDKPAQIIGEMIDGNGWTHLWNRAAPTRLIFPWRKVAPDASR